MELYRYSDRIYYSAYEEKRDRPALGYIRGDKYSIAIDAGHSDAHVEEFYEQLNQEKLPLPQLTILTHWHWDHTFAMHKIHGLSVANKRTNAYLKDFIAARSPKEDEKFLHLDPSIALEYAGNREIVVVPADIEFEGQITFDAGNITAFAYEAPSAHTDDSTLIYVPEEKVLFFGDALSGVFPTWVADPVLLKAFIETIEESEAEYCIGGHWPIFRKEDLVRQLKGSL